MPRCTIATVVSMLSTILVAVPAFSRVEPAMTSGPTAGEMTMSTKVCNSVPGQQVRNTILTPLRRARVSAPRTNCVIPLAEMPTSTSLRVGCRRATARAPSSKLSSTPACDRKNAARPPAMIAWTRCIGGAERRSHLGRLEDAEPAARPRSDEDQAPSLVERGRDEVRGRRDACLLARHRRENLAVLAQHQVDHVLRGRLIQCQAGGVDGFGRKVLPLRGHAETHLPS